MRNKTLIDRLQKGDKKALEELYDQFSPVLLVVSLRYLNNRNDAEDVLHDAFIKILSGLKTFQSRFEGSLEAWMKKITVNTCINYLKSQQKNQKMNGSLFDNLTTENTLSEETSDLKEDINPEKIIELIQTLPAGYRTVLNLYVFENYTHKEISGALGISENTSKSQLLKARAYLRKKLSTSLKTVLYTEHERI